MSRMREKMEAFYQDLATRHVPDIEEHCRRVHADAVCNTFMVLFGAPLRFLQENIKKMCSTRREPSAH